jgi:hypothetical protein
MTIGQKEKNAIYDDKKEKEVVKAFKVRIAQLVERNSEDV